MKIAMNYLEMRSEKKLNREREKFISTLLNIYTYCPAQSVDTVICIPHVVHSRQSRPFYHATLRRRDIHAMYSGRWNEESPNFMKIHTVTGAVSSANYIFADKFMGEISGIGIASSV